MAPEHQLIGAVLPKGSAASATLDLEQAGLVEHEVISAPEHARDHAAPSAERRLGGGLLRGAGIGALLVSTGMMILAALTSPPEARTVSIATGGGAGVVTGAFLGAYVEMTRHRRRVWRQRDLEQVETGPHEVLVVVDTTHSPSRAEEILVRHGGRIVTPAHPDD